MELAFKVLGNGQPIIILHGLYGSSDNWHQIGKKLSGNFKVYLIDHRNHGNSPHSNQHNYNVLTEDLNDFIDKQKIEKPIIIGHSMGGKVAMHFSKTYSEKIKKLIVVDISPFDYSKYEKQKSNFETHNLILDSVLSLKLHAIKSRGEADKYLLEKIPSKPIRQFILKNLKRTDYGFTWKINVRILKNEMPEIMKGIEFNKVELNNIKNLPTLFIKGENSSYILNNDIDKIIKIYPKAIFKKIQNAGHWLHAEKPEEFVKIVSDFI